MRPYEPDYTYMGDLEADRISVCEHCGALVPDLIISMHDAWHKDVNDALSGDVETAVSAKPENRA